MNLPRKELPKSPSEFLRKNFLEVKVPLQLTLLLCEREDCEVIQQFQHYRNKLFHGDEGASFYFIMTDAEKEPIIENAVDAVKILQAIGFGTRYK